MAEISVQEDLPHEESVRGNWAWQVLRYTSDAANLPSHFYCRVCRKNVSVLIHGHQEVLRRFQGSRHFDRDQRLRLETPGWRVLDFHGIPLSEDELERQKEKIRRRLPVVRDFEHPLEEDLITDGVGIVDPQLPVLT